jgi:hypothetical protein
MLSVVSVVRCVGSALCNGLIFRSEESYRLCVCVCVCVCVCARARARLPVCLSCV